MDRDQLLRRTADIDRSAEAILRCAGDARRARSA